MATRRAYPVLGKGSCEFIALENKAVLAYLRRSDEAQMLIVCNLSDQPQTVDLPLPDGLTQTPVDVLTDTTLPDTSGSSYTLTLSPYQYLWIKVAG